MKCSRWIALALSCVLVLCLPGVALGWTDMASPPVFSNNPEQNTWVWYDIPGTIEWAEIDYTGFWALTQVFNLTADDSFQYTMDDGSDASAAIDFNALEGEYWLSPGDAHGFLALTSVDTRVIDRIKDLDGRFFEAFGNNTYSWAMVDGDPFTRVYQLTSGDDYLSQLVHNANGTQSDFVADVGPNINIQHHVSMQAIAGVRDGDVIPMSMRGAAYTRDDVQNTAQFGMLDDDANRYTSVTLADLTTGAINNIRYVEWDGADYVTCATAGDFDVSRTFFVVALETDDADEVTAFQARLDSFDASAAASWEPSGTPTPYKVPWDWSGVDFSGLTSGTIVWGDTALPGWLQPIMQDWWDAATGWITDAMSWLWFIQKAGESEVPLYEYVPAGGGGAG